MQNIIINKENSENLQNFSQILNKDVNSILNEALQEYFIDIQKQFLEKNIADENALTNLNFDEFWEDVEI